MPANERKKIRLEIEKLFDLGESPGESVDQREAKKPISPPTEWSGPPDKMRLSMGSRPLFLSELQRSK